MICNSPCTSFKIIGIFHIFKITVGDFTRSCVALLYNAHLFRINDEIVYIYEHNLDCEKTGLRRGFRPGLTQTDPYGHRSRLDA